MGTAIPGSAGSGAPTGDQPQQGVPGTPGGNQGAPTTPVPGATTDPTQPVANPEAQKYAQEAAAARAKIKELEAQLKTTSDAQLTEQQRMARDLQELQLQQGTWAQMQQGSNLMLGIYRLAGRLGLRADVSADDVAGMMAGSYAVTFDEHHQPVDLENALRTFLAARPWLTTGQAAPTAGQQPPAVPTGGVGNPGRASGVGGQAPQITDAFIASLTPSTYEALPQTTKDAIRAYQMRMQRNPWGRR